MRVHLALYRWFAPQVEPELAEQQAAEREAR